MRWILASSQLLLFWCTRTPSARTKNRSDSCANKWASNKYLFPPSTAYLNYTVMFGCWHFLSLMSMVKIVPRGHTAVVDAYLTPLIKQYIKGFSGGFDDKFSQVDVSFMMSDGGLCPVDLFNGYRSILSGPAGGVVGYAMTTYDKNTKQPVIGIDMVIRL